MEVIVININSDGEVGYSRNIYLSLGNIIYEIVGYSDKKLTGKCI